MLGVVVGGGLVEFISDEDADKVCCEVCVSMSECSGKKSARESSQLYTFHIKEQRGILRCQLVPSKNPPAAPLDHRDQRFAHALAHD